MPSSKLVRVTLGIETNLKRPCLFPLADGRRCLECATCQPSCPCWVGGEYFCPEHGPGSVVGSEQEETQ